MSLFSWMFGKSNPTNQLHLVLYTREGCHLCEDALAILEQARQRHPFKLEIIDIGPDAELTRMYGEEIPVVVVNGKVRFRGRVNPVLLTRLLRAGSGRG